MSRLPWGEVRKKEKKKRSGGDAETGLPTVDICLFVCFAASSNLVRISTDHADAFLRVPEIYHTSTGIPSINNGTILTNMTRICVYAKSEHLEAILTRLEKKKRN